MNPDALADLLAATGMTRAQVAAAANLSPSALSQLASGASRASQTTVLALSGALGCRAGTLFPEAVVASAGAYTWEPAT